jgi:hypothetical protein
VHGCKFLISLSSFRLCKLRARPCSPGTLRERGRRVRTRSRSDARFIQNYAQEHKPLLGVVLWEALALCWGDRCSLVPPFEFCPAASLGFRIAACFADSNSMPNFVIVQSVRGSRYGRCIKVSCPLGLCLAAVAGPGESGR